MRFRLERARRFWAVYEVDTLVCITVYKKGALAVIDRLTRPPYDQLPEMRKDTSDEPDHHVLMP